MTESRKTVRKWYVGKNFGSGEVFIVCRADWDGSILLSQESWFVPNGDKWNPTKLVGKWFFVGDDDIWESTEEEVASYLPENAIKL